MDRCLELEKEVRNLNYRIEELESLLYGGTHKVFPKEWNLTASEKKIVRFILNRDLATTESLMTMLYSINDDDSIPFDNIIGVFMTKIRQKLKPHGISILRSRSEGYYMTKEDKAKVKQILNDLNTTNNDQTVK